jgi:hypothetical protein
LGWHLQSKASEAHRTAYAFHALCHLWLEFGFGGYSDTFKTVLGRLWRKVAAGCTFELLRLTALLRAFLF